MSDNRPNNHVRVLCFAHSLCSFWKLVVAFMGQKTHIQYAMKSSCCTAENTSVWVRCRCLKITRALQTSRFCSFRFQLNLWAHCQHQFLWLLSAPKGVSVSEWTAAGSQAGVFQVDGCGPRVQPVNHRRPRWNLCAHKNTIISERNDKNSWMSLLHSHFVPICFNATIYEPLCSCTIFKTLTVFFPFFPSE